MSIPAHDTCNKNKAFFTDIKGGYTYILQTKNHFNINSCRHFMGIIGGAYQLLLTIYAEKIFPYEHWDFIYGSRGWAYDRKPSR